MNRIKNLFVLAILCIAAISLNAQETQKPQEVQEPTQAEKKMDEQDAPVLSPPTQMTASIGDAEVTIDYSAPSVRGRAIWGELVPYDKVWRTGANAATTISLSKDILVEGNVLAAGKYALFTIPSADHWTIIFNSNPDQWGHYDYDESKDVLRVEVAPMESGEMVETLQFDVNEAGEESQIVMKWEKLMVPISIAPAVN